jgi:hypothetical protein
MNSYFEYLKKKLTTSEDLSPGTGKEQQDLFLILELLKNANIFNLTILNWLLTLDAKQLDNLKRVLVTLEDYQVLNEAFFPLFIYYQNGQFNLASSCLALLKSMNVHNSFTTATQEILFRQLLSRIETRSLQQGFFEFESLIIHYLKAQSKMKRLAIDINIFFINLIQCRILTLQRLKTILNNGEKISNIVAAFRIETTHDNLTEKNDDIAIHNEFFEILLLHALDPATVLHWEVVEIIQKHRDDFRKVYAAALLRHPQPRILWEAIIELSLTGNLNPDNFSAIGLEQPLVKAKIMTHLFRHEVAINDKLEIIKKYTHPHLLRKKLIHITRDLDNCEIKTELIDHFFRLLSDRMEIIERAQTLAQTTHNSPQSFFSLLPLDLLTMTAACSQFAAHNKEAAMNIVINTWNKIQEQPSSPRETIEDLRELYATELNL